MNASHTLWGFFWQAMRPYKWHYLLMFIMPVLASTAPTLGSYAIKCLVDLLTSQTVTFSIALFWPVALFVGSEAFRQLCWRICNVPEWRAKPQVAQRLLLQAYDNVQGHAYSFFQNNQTGSLTSKVNSIVNGYNTVVDELQDNYLVYLAGMLFGLIALFLVYWPLALVLLVWMLAAGYTTYKFSLKVGKHATSQAESLHTAMGRIADCITNIFTIFSFATRRRECKVLESQLYTDFVPKQTKMYWAEFNMQIMAMLIYLPLFLSILIWVIALRKQGILTIGEVAYVLMLMLFLCDQVWNFTWHLKDVFKQIGDLKGALTVLCPSNEGLDAPNAQPLQVKNAQIELQSVNFGYGNNDGVLKALTLTISAGEKVGLVGASGAGKTSLMNLLLRYFTPSDGQILIDGQDIATVTADSLRENISVIPQDTMLFHRSLLENIRYAKPNATEAEVIAVCQKAQLHSFITSLPEGYNTEVGERGIKLSGGQRQRVAIARAMLKHAPILILDEATSALDSETEREIQQSLNAIISERGTTVVAIAHRLSTLKHMDRIIVLDQGVITQQGTHNELINQPGLYKTLWEGQVGVK